MMSCNTSGQRGANEFRHYFDELEQERKLHCIFCIMTFVVIQCCSDTGLTVKCSEGTDGGAVKSWWAQKKMADIAEDIC